MHPSLQRDTGRIRNLAVHIGVSPFNVGIGCLVGLIYFFPEALVNRYKKRQSTVCAGVDGSLGMIYVSVCRNPRVVATIIDATLTESSKDVGILSR